MPGDTPDWTHFVDITGLTGTSPGIAFHDFGAAIAGGVRLTLLAFSTVGISLYGIHCILDAGYLVGQAGDLLLQWGTAGNFTTITHFTVDFPFDDWIPLSGVAVGALQNIVLLNNTAVSLTVRGTLNARDQASG